jgi:hypothetical protein
MRLTAARGRLDAIANVSSYSRLRRVVSGLGDPDAHGPCSVDPILIRGISDSRPNRIYLGWEKFF